MVGLLTPTAAHAVVPELHLTTSTTTMYSVADQMRIRVFTASADVVTIYATSAADSNTTEEMCSITPVATSMTSNDFGMSFSGEASCRLPVNTTTTRPDLGSNKTLTISATQTVDGNLTSSNENPEITWLDSSIETVTSTTSSSLIFPYKDGFRDNNKITLTIAAYNVNGDQVPAVFESSLDKGAPVQRTSARNTDGSAHSVSIPFTIPANAFRAHSITTWGAAADGTRASDVVTITVKRTSVTRASIARSAATFYPKRDGYLDSETFTLQATSSTGRALKGSGVFTVKNPKGKVVLTKKFTSSATHRIIWNGLTKGKVVAGTYRASYQFVGPQGTKASTSVAFVVSPKKLVTKTIKKTYTAWSTFDNCAIGDSYEPCDQGDSRGNLGGIRIYSSGSGDTMIVGASLPVTGIVSKWRVNFKGYTAPWGGDAFYYAVTDEGWNTLRSNLVRLPVNDAATVHMPWSKVLGGDGYVYFTISSLAWASIYLNSCQIEYVTRTLQ